MSKTNNSRALDRDELEMVDQSKALDGLSASELRDLIGRLRARRDRAQRQIRSRTRAAQSQGKARAADPGPDTGAREKKALLNEAVARVADEIKQRSQSRKADKGAVATQNLRDAVARKSASPSWTGPENRTADTGPAETPNTKVAPSGALHAEGMRAVISRTVGQR